MSVWDQHADFLAEQAARLATHDELEAQGLLELMRNAYEKAREATHSKWIWINGKAKVEIRDGQGRFISPPYQSQKDPLPKDALYSQDLIGHIREIFDTEGDSDFHNELVEIYEYWHNNSKKLNFSSRFEVQRFGRNEMHRWLAVRGIESKYPFIQMASTSEFQPNNSSRDQRSEVNHHSSAASLENRALDVVDSHKSKNLDQKVPQTAGRSWFDSCGDYVLDAQRIGRYGTAKDLFKALEGAAKEGQGPFEIGQGNQRGSLVIKETRKTVAFKTIQNRWAEILKNADRSSP